INTLPLRARITPDQPLSLWLTDLQSRQVQARRFEHIPLIQMQGWSDIPHGQYLIENVLTFNNYPQKIGLKGAANESEVTMDDFRSATYTGLPLEIDAAPAAELTLTMRYDREHFNDARIARLLDNFTVLLNLMVAHNEATLGRLLQLLEDADQAQSVRGA